MHNDVLFEVRPASIGRLTRKNSSALRSLAGGFARNRISTWSAESEQFTNNWTMLRISALLLNNLYMYLLAHYGPGLLVGTRTAQVAVGGADQHIGSRSKKPMAENLNDSNNVDTLICNC